MERSGDSLAASVPDQGTPTPWCDAKTKNLGNNTEFYTLAHNVGITNGRGWRTPDACSRLAGASVFACDRWAHEKKEEFEESTTTVLGMMLHSQMQVSREPDLIGATTCERGRGRSNAVV